MSDYIKREDAIDACLEEISTKWSTKEEAEEGRIIASVIKSFPSADVVKVVRCKDCMYNNNGWCGSQEYGTRHVEDNDYCSFGERKVTEAQEEAEIINARKGEE